ncbi:hypothetical protein [Methylobacter sp.]|uniref:hypothetical protein n=1 Tax=Methylobacter sp. TaxID=2051955 RepID=UPI003DA63556
MKISVNGQDLFELSEIQCKVICNDIHGDIFDEDMKRRLQWVLMHKYEQCFNRLKAEWDSKLAENGVSSIPLNKDEYAQLVFSQPNYKCRKDRDLAESVVV